MARYEPFLKDEYNRDFFLDFPQWSSGKFGNSYEDALSRALYRLLKSGKQSSTLNVEDKVEVNYNLFISSCFPSNQLLVIYR
jgi:hypothetical protein